MVRTNVLELGSLIERHIFIVYVTFDSASLNFSPYVSLGMQYVYFSPEASSDVGDLFVEARWHYDGSDFVDGLDHDNPENKSND